MMEGMTIYFDGSQAQLITTSNQSKRSMCNFGPTGLSNNLPPKYPKRPTQKACTKLWYSYIVTLMDLNNLAYFVKKKKKKKKKKRKSVVL